MPIYEIVYCSNRTLAVAAGEFLNVKVFTTTATAALNGSTSAASEANDVRQQLADLVTFYVEGAVHNHAAYLVDALIDINPMLKDWSTMIDMLLNDECTTFTSLRTFIIFKNLMVFQSFYLTFLFCIVTLYLIENYCF